MMATPEVAITKATLSATLFRADPTPLSRPSVEAFFPLLTNAMTQCSRPNVQKCKAWIVENIAPSTSRSVALAKYMAALSKNLEDDGARPSIKRRKLHLLYVVNDVLHHVARKNRDASFATVWDPLLPRIIADTAAFKNSPKHKKKVENLIDIWEENRYFSPDIVSNLRNAAVNGVVSQAPVDTQIANPSVKLAKDVGYILPSLHGDPSTPWYDLPASTWLPHLTPNSTKPLIPDLVRPIQLAPGHADKVLATAVQDLLLDVKRLFSKDSKWDDDSHTDINELGERVILDEINNDVIGGETYYGWSRQFCEKMKQRKKRDLKGPSRGRSNSRSSSYSRGRSHSSPAPALKRRRYSTGSPDRSRSRSGSYSPDRRRMDQPNGRGGEASPDRGYRPGYGASRQRTDLHTQSRSRSPSYHRNYPDSDQHRLPPQPPHSFGSFPQFQPNAPLSANFPHAPPPPPPPPPSGYTGTWPPPPPPPGMPGMPGIPGMPAPWFPNGTMPPMMGAWGTPQFPPQPPPPQNNYYGGGRGGGNRGGYNSRGGNSGFGGRGRGGYDGGRGGW